jgi:hypothetical protein
MRRATFPDGAGKVAHGIPKSLQTFRPGCKYNLYAYYIMLAASTHFRAKASIRECGLFFEREEADDYI